MSIEDQKKERKFMFQFIDHTDGRRSEPFVGNWETISEIIKLREGDQLPKNEDYILLVAVLDDEDTIIPSTPLITIQTFLDMTKNEATENV